MIDKEMKEAEKACRFFCGGDCLRNWEDKMNSPEDLVSWLRKNEKCKDCSAVARTIEWLEKNS